jgi:O-antigen ligase
LLGLIQGIAIPLASGDRWSFSRDVEATRAAVIVIFFLFFLVLIASNFFTTRESLTTLAIFLTIYGFALAVFAIIQHLTWDGKLFWFREVKAASGYAGPFVNRNHFAGYIEMLAPLSFAMALMRRNDARWLFGFAAVMMGVSVVASLSRGGMVSLAAGLLFIAAFEAFGKRRRESHSAAGADAGFSPRGAGIARPLALIGLVAVSIVAGIIWVGADLGVAERLAAPGVESPSGRYGIWTDSLKMVAANPVAGVGLGAYQTVFPIYAQGDGSLIIEFAHNDYIQVLTDAGLIGGALAIWFLILLGRSFLRSLDTRDPRLRTIALGCGGGIFALLIHSLFDFNLQLPSNALLFLLLCSVVWQIGGTRDSSLSAAIVPRKQQAQTA